MTHNNWPGSLSVWDAGSGKELCRHAPGGNDGLAAALLTADGRSIVTVERTGPQQFVCIRDRRTLKEVRRFPVGYMHPPCLTPDGKRLIALNTGGKEHQIEIWNLQKGARIRSSSVGAGGHWWAVEFARDGKTLATGGADRVIRVWDVETGRLRRELPNQPDVVSKLALSPDGKRIASLAMHEVKVGMASVFPWDNRIHILDLQVGQKAARAAHGRQGRLLWASAGLLGPRVAPDSKRLATAGTDGMVRMWDVATGQEQWAFAMHRAAAMVLAFAADGRTLAVGSPVLRLIDTATGKEQRPPFGHVSGVASAAVAPDGRTIATGGEDHIQLWDATTGRPIRRLAGHDRNVSVLQFAHDGRSLLSAGVDKTVRVWDVRTGTQQRRIEVAGAEPRPLAVTRDGNTAAVAHRDGSIGIADLATGKERARLPTAKESAAGTAFAVGGRTLIVWQRDHGVRVWDWPAGKQVRHFAFWDPPDRAVPPGGTGDRRDLPYAAAVSPDGRFIAYGSQGPSFPIKVKQYLAIQEIATGKTLRVVEAPLPEGVGLMVFSPDGRSLAVSGGQPAIHIMEFTTGKERLRLDGHKGRVVSLAFAADGRTLVSGSEDTTALVWDVCRTQRAKHVPLDREAAWRDLATDDAAAAYAAMCRLAVAPKEAAALLGERVKPIAAPAAKRLAKLIADLDSDEFDVRAAAQRELERLGERAVGACRAALRTARSLESRRRLERPSTSRRPRRRGPVANGCACCVRSRFWRWPAPRSVARCCNAWPTVRRERSSRRRRRAVCGGSVGRSGSCGGTFSPCRAATTTGQRGPAIPASCQDSKASGKRQRTNVARLS